MFLLLPIRQHTRIVCTPHLIPLFALQLGAPQSFSDDVEEGENHIVNGLCTELEDKNDGASILQYRQGRRNQTLVDMS